MDREVNRRVDSLNKALLAIREYKKKNPKSAIPFYRTIPGSILNAYREGDIGFDECLDLIRAVNESHSRNSSANWIRLRLDSIEDESTFTSAQVRQILSQI